MDTTQRFVATHLDDVLKQQGRSRVWLARRIGVSPSLMQFICTGRRTASAEVVRDVEAALGVPFFLMFESTEVSRMATAVERQTA